MRTTRRIMITVVVVALVGFLSGVARADWFEGDDHKMHYPQLPDPFGWDVNATYPKVLADDWQCSETGPVSDVHLWGSWEFGQGEASLITRIHLSIHSNIPETATGGFSMPGDLLWERDFFTGEFTMIDPYGTGDQGWYDPNTGEFRPSDHDLFNQINFVDIRDPFIQTQGEIYWLDVSVETVTESIKWGWKTTQDHFMDDAVWADVIDDPGGITQWQELRDPTDESLDLAFVITPEPATLVVLALGLIPVLLKRRR